MGRTPLARRGHGAACASLAVALAASLAAAGCGTTWDRRALARARPDLADVDTARLAEGMPYAWPAGGALALLLCRWSVDEPLTVTLPGDATADERGLLVRALRAWQGAGLGVRFRVIDAGPAQVALRFDDDPESGLAGTTAAECALEAPRVDAQPGETLAARLAHAAITLRRVQMDALGRPVPLTREELMGSAVHELGHALGFQGHARRGHTVMQRAVAEVRKVGRRLLRGEPLRDDALAALYRLPSGLVVARRPLAAGVTAPVDALLAGAARAGFGGPFLRVGDRGARVSWVEGERVLAVDLPDLPQRLERGEPLVLRPDAAARAWLGISRSRGRSPAPGRAARPMPRHRPAS